MLHGMLVFPRFYRFLHPACLLPPAAFFTSFTGMPDGACWRAARGRRLDVPIGPVRVKGSTRLQRLLLLASLSPYRSGLNGTLPYALRQRQVHALSLESDLQVVLLVLLCGSHCTRNTTVKRSRRLSAVRHHRCLEAVACDLPAIECDFQCDRLVACPRGRRVRDRSFDLEWPTEPSRSQEVPNSHGSYTRYSSGVATPSTPASVRVVCCVVRLCRTV